VPPTELRPRSATEIIDAAFQILKQQYGTFVVLAALAYLPYIIFMLAVGASTSGASQDEMSVTALGAGMLALPIALIWFPIAESAVLVGASDALLGRPVDAGAALRLVLSRFGNVLGAALLKVMLVFLATLFLLVPGVIVWLGLFATPAVVVFERLGAAESIGRSWNLAKGMKGKVLGVMLLAYLVVIAVQLAVEMVAQAIGLNPIMGSVASSVLVIFIYPLIGICTALLYYDARIRKEGFDLQVLASELEGASGPAPYASTH
jgi:hypothetical protein